MELTTTNKLPLEIKGTWDSAREWNAAAGTFEQCKLYCQVMLGFELLALHKSLAVKPGNPNFQSSQVGKIGDGSNWGDLLTKEMGLSSSSAYRFMDMAKAAAARLKKLPLLQGFDPKVISIGALREEQKAELKTGVQKLTDNLTQQEFGEENGLWKLPYGSGGGNPNAKGKRKLSLTEQAALLQQQANQDWTDIELYLLAYEVKFTVLPDIKVESQIAWLEEQLTARKTWLRQPLKERDPKAIAAILERRDV